jgi:hypothetical protein
MHAIPQISRSEARVLIDDPYRRLRLIQPLCPRDDCSIECLHFSVVVSDTQWYDLCDLGDGVSSDLEKNKYIGNSSSRLSADRDTYNNLHLRITRPHRRNQFGKGSNNIACRLALLHDVIRAQMHGNHIRWVCLQPPV